MNRTLTAIPGKLMSEYIVQLLNKNGISLIRDFLDADSDTLCKMLHMHTDNVSLLKKHVIQYFGPKQYSLSTYFRSRKAVKAIYQTGIKSLDKLLSDEGYEQLCSGSIWDVGGLIDTGKTILLTTLALNFVSNYDGVVYFIDANHDFSGSRLYEMLKCRGATKSKCVQAMQAIRVDYVKTVEDVINVLETLLEKLSRDSKDVVDIKMILIDSIPAAVFHLFRDDKNKMKCQIAILVMLIRKLAKQHYIMFIMSTLMLTFNEISDQDETEDVWSQGNNFIHLDEQTQSNSAKDMIERPYLGFPWKGVANFCLALDIPINSSSSDYTLINDSSYRVLKVVSGCHTATGVSCLVRLTETGVI